MPGNMLIFVNADGQTNCHLEPETSSGKGNVEHVKKTKTLLGGASNGANFSGSLSREGDWRSFYFRKTRLILEPSSFLAPSETTIEWCEVVTLGNEGEE